MAALLSRTLSMASSCLVFPRRFLSGTRTIISKMTVDVIFLFIQFFSVVVLLMPRGGVCDSKEWSILP